MDCFLERTSYLSNLHLVTYPLSTDTGNHAIVQLLIFDKSPSVMKITITLHSVLFACAPTRGMRPCSGLPLWDRERATNSNCESIAKIIRCLLWRILQWNLHTNLFDLLLHLLAETTLCLTLEKVHSLILNFHLAATYWNLGLFV